MLPSVRRAAPQGSTWFLPVAHFVQKPGRFLLLWVVLSLAIIFGEGANVA